MMLNARTNLAEYYIIRITNNGNKVYLSIVGDNDNTEVIWTSIIDLAFKFFDVDQLQQFAHKYSQHGTIELVRILNRRK